MSRVATITRQLQQNYVATLSNYVAIDSKKKTLNHVTIEIASHDKELGNKDENYVAIKQPIRPEFLRIHNFSLEVLPIT